MKTISKIKDKIFTLIASIKFKKKVIAFGFFYVGNIKNVLIGENCRINKGVYLLGRNRIEIGNNVILSAEVMILDSGLDVDMFKKENMSTHINSFVKIEDNVWIGARGLILPGVTIHNNSIVAAGSVVVKDVPPYTLVGGNPAKVIRKLK